MSLLGTWYLSPAANVLTWNPKILDVNNRDFFLLYWLCNDYWLWSKCFGVDFKCACARLQCCLWKDPLKWDFLDIYLTTFSEFVISELKKLWGSCFFAKRSKFQIDFKMAAKNSENLFCFSDNCMWIGNVILPLF